MSSSCTGAVRMVPWNGPWLLPRQFFPIQRNAIILYCSTLHNPGSWCGVVKWSVHQQFCLFLFYVCSSLNETRRDSVVGIATGYRLDDRGVRVRVLVRSRIFFTASRPALGSIQPPIQWVLGVKQPEREADRSLPARAEVKKMRVSIHPLPHTPLRRTA
jgi:hypothetical protein